MKIAFKREWLEYGTLLIVLGLLFWLGPGTIWDHKIDYGYPYAFNAEDTFHHQARTEGILRVGHYKYEPIEHVTGIYPDYPGYYPPGFSQLATVWTAFDGLESYHTTPGLMFLSTLASAGLMYFLIKKFNPKVALLSLPLFIYLFSSSVAMRYFTWGHWPSIFGHTFLLLIGWGFSQLEIAHWEILLILIFTGGVMTYTSWMIMVGMFLVLFLIMHTAKKGLHPTFLLKLGFIGIGTIVLSSRYLIIFYNILITLKSANRVLLAPLTGWPGGGGVLTPQMFGTVLGLVKLWWLILIGAVLAAIILVLRFKQDKNSKSWAPLLFSITMLGLGYSHYIGFGKRAFLLRLFWPLYLSIFFGLFVYHTGNLIFRQLKMRWNTAIISILVGALVLVVFFTVPRSSSGSGMMTPDLWEAITWLRDDTPKHTTFAIMYGDVLGSDMLWNLHRHHFLIDKEGYIEALQNLTVKRHYSSIISSHIYSFRIVPADHHKKNPLFWGWEWNMSLDYLLRRDRDICAYDYILFTKHSREPVLAQYGLYIANLLLEKPWITVAFENNYAFILHNAKIGDACIEEQKIQQAEG